VSYSILTSYASTVFGSRVFRFIPVLLYCTYAGTVIAVIVPAAAFVRHAFGGSWFHVSRKGGKKKMITRCYKNELSSITVSYFFTCRSAFYRQQPTTTTSVVVRRYVNGVNGKRQKTNYIFQLHTRCDFWH
jgi:hypothetical protein